MGGDNIIIPNITVIHEGDKMKVKSLDIKGIGGIKELSLKFNDGLNVICGANGIGKTTVLNVIADSFSIASRTVRRNALTQEGKYTINFDDSKYNTQEIIKTFAPSEFPGRIGVVLPGKYLLNFSTLREIQYLKLDGIPRDNIRSDHDAGYMAVSGIQANDLKGWFANRYVFSLQDQGFTEAMKRNLGIAIQIFSLIDKDVKFEYVDPRTLDIMINTSKGTVYFEYLSSGYKTCIYIILGILKELDYRFPDAQIAFDDFDGIILIDEVDLHLHPTWQVQLINSLKIIFAKAQIIATTHSPSILQSLEKDEIIALAQDEEGNTFVKELDLGEYGLQGWTLEEILQDVMGMPSTTSELYENTINEFDKAMDEEDGVKIMEQYEILKKMLHPKNPLQKLLKLQVAEWEE